MRKILFSFLSVILVQLLAKVHCRNTIVVGPMEVLNLKDSVDGGKRGRRRPPEHVGVGGPDGLIHHEDGGETGRVEEGPNKDGGTF
jgi:hypothetical protein